MAVLITGGYGQLGSWLANEFAKAGEEVLLLDVVKRRIDYLEGFEDKLAFVPASVLDFPRLVEVFKDAAANPRGPAAGPRADSGARPPPVDGIVHSAAVMATPEFWGNPHAGLSMNVMGTVNLLEAARSLRHTEVSLRRARGPCTARSRRIANELANTR